MRRWAFIPLIFLAVTARAGWFNGASLGADQTVTGAWTFNNDLVVTGTLTVKSALIQFGTVDTNSRTQIWNKGTNSILRLGSSQADGDGLGNNTDSEGIIIYYPTGDNAARIKADRVALTRNSDTTLNYFIVNASSMMYRANPPSGAIHLYVDRTTGYTGVWTGTPATQLDLNGTTHTGDGLRLPIYTAAELVASTPTVQGVFVSGPSPTFDIYVGTGTTAANQWLNKRTNANP